MLDHRVDGLLIDRRRASDYHQGGLREEMTFIRTKTFFHKERQERGIVHYGCH